MTLWNVPKCCLFVTMGTKYLREKLSSSLLIIRSLNKYDWSEAQFTYHIPVASSFDCIQDCSRSCLWNSCPSKPQIWPADRSDTGPEIQPNGHVRVYSIWKNLAGKNYLETSFAHIINDNIYTVSQKAQHFLTWISRRWFDQINCPFSMLHNIAI